MYFQAGLLWHDVDIYLQTYSVEGKARESREGEGIVFATCFINGYLRTFSINIQIYCIV